MLYHGADAEGLRSRIRQSQPSVEYLKRIYQAVANHLQLAVGGSEGESYDFRMEEFTSKFGFRPADAFAAMKKLEEENLLQLSDAFHRPSKVHLLMDKGHIYEFQVANAKFDPLIKAILRIHGGELFSDFVSVSESAISKMSGLNETEVRNYLNGLSKLAVLEYVPATDKPQITFLTPRQDADRLPLDTERLKLRRTLATEKGEAMIHYAEQNHRCRMQEALAYFDETSFEKCGMCDWCIAGRRKLDETSFLSLEQQVAELVSQRPMTIEELEEALKPSDKDLFVEVVRDLVDRGELKYDEYWVLRKANSK